MGSFAVLHSELIPDLFLQAEVYHIVICIHSKLGGEDCNHLLKEKSPYPLCG